MGWEVKTDMKGQPKHDLWGSNVKIGKYLPGNYKGWTSCTVCSQKL